MGWWWARALNLGDILPIDHVKSSLQATFTQNHVTAFDPSEDIVDTCTLTYV